MSGGRGHIAGALISSLHKTKNVARPPMATEQEEKPDAKPEGQLLNPAELDTEHRLSVVSEEGSRLSSCSSINTLSSSSSDLLDTDDAVDEPTTPPGATLTPDFDPRLLENRDASPKRAKSNSICVGTVLNPLTASPRRRAGSFLQLHLPDFGFGGGGPHTADPKFHIPTFTITAPAGDSAASTRKFSSAFHGFGAFALRRHSNTSLHRTESMVSLCFRSLSNLINENNLAALQSFLSNKQVLVDDKDENGTTALMVACQRGSPSMVTELLAHGADPNIDDNDGWTALLLAAKNGRINVCIDLLNHGAQIDHQEMGGWTALMWASYKGHEDVVALLIDKGADVNVQGNFHISSLIWAAGRGFSGIVDRLLAAGARPNSADKYGTTPLIWAARKGNAHAVKSLLAAGAAPDQAGMYSWTALLQATSGNHIDIVQMLLEHKPNVNALDKDGCTALAIACKEGFSEIAIALLNSGAYVNIQDRGADTCLIHAVKGGHRSIVEALLKKYADVDILGKDRKTAVYNAVEKGHAGILRLLLLSNPDLELSTKDGDTPLLKAVRARNGEMVQLLLDKKAKVNVTDKRGDNCLHIAMRARSKGIVEILLRNPKDSQLLYRPNRAQETPYNIDMNYPKTILGQIFGARRLNTNDDNESLLGYELYSSALADMLSEPSLSMPITVGLYARWGSGKSFLLNKLKEEMKNFGRQWIELGWQWNWAVAWGLWHFAIAGGTISHLAGLSWALSIAISALILVLLYVILIALWFASRKYEWSWPYTVMLALSNKFNSLQLVLQVVFCHPPGPQCTHSLPSQPVRFHFTDQAKSSTQEGEACVIQMIVSLSEALENQYGKLCPRLYRAFRPKPIRSTANWRWRRLCCIPNVLAFEAFVLCAIFGICTLVVYLTDDYNTPEVGAILKGVLIGVGVLLSVTVVANLHTLRRMLSALFFSPRSHIKRSVDKQPEGFLQALRPEISLITSMVKCLDAFTGQQTRLVVVIDALDSCEQDKVLIVLNAIHTLCSDQHNPFITILAIDPHIISKAVEVNSKRAFTESNIGGWDYLKNMVQLPFYLQNSALRRVKTAQQTSHKKSQFLNADDVTASLQRSVSARRLSTASEIMSSQEKLKGLGSSSSRSIRKLKISESVASSMNSNLHKVGLSAGPADLNRVLLTDDYFSDVNPRSMQRLMNVLYITGRLLKAFQIEFNWYHLATWVNLTEQWPFRTSWIILHHEMLEEHMEDNTSLKNIYDKLKPNIPALKEIEPLMELDRDERKLEVFLGFHRSTLLVSDLKIFLPFTINLDPYIKKVIKDEQQQLDNDVVNPIIPLNKPQSTKFFTSRHKPQAPRTTLPPIYGGMTPSGWPSWPEPSMQPNMPTAMQATPPIMMHMTPPLYTQFHSDLGDVHLSKLGTSNLCSLIERQLPKAAASLTQILRQENITGQVLQHCDLNELKVVLKLNFGDWEMFKILVLTLREMDSAMGPSISVTQDKDRPEKELKSRSTHDSIKSKQSMMEKQVTLEEQMICGALQTLNEEALEDVLQVEPPCTQVSDESDSLQLVLLAPGAGWQPTTPPTSLTASPILPRRSDPILKPKGSLKNSSIKKHVSINENRFSFESYSSLKNCEIAPVIVKIEDETEKKDNQKCSVQIISNINEKKDLVENIPVVVNVPPKESDLTKSEVVADVTVKESSEEQIPATRRKPIRTSRPRPSSLLLSNEDTLPIKVIEQHSNRSKSVENNCSENPLKLQTNSDNNATLPSVELINRLKEKVFIKSNSIERCSKHDLESDDESTPLMSSERSSPSPSVKTPGYLSNDTPQCSPSPNAKNSSNSSLETNSPANTSQRIQRPIVHKNFSPELPDCINSDVTVSVDFSPSPDCSLCDSRHYEGGNSFAESSRSMLSGPSSPRRSFRRSKSAQSVPQLLDPYQMDVLSHGVSDVSIRSYLWRQNAVEDEEDWNPESSV